MNGVSLSFDETCTLKDLERILLSFAQYAGKNMNAELIFENYKEVEFDSNFLRTDNYMSQPIFKSH